MPGDRVTGKETGVQLKALRVRTSQDTPCTFFKNTVQETFLPLLRSWGPSFVDQGDMRARYKTGTSHPLCQSPQKQVKRRLAVVSGPKLSLLAPGDALLPCVQLLVLTFKALPCP